MSLRRSIIRNNSTNEFATKLSWDPISNAQNYLLRAGEYVVDDLPNTEVLLQGKNYNAVYAGDYTVTAVPDPDLTYYTESERSNKIPLNLCNINSMTRRNTTEVQIDIAKSTAFPTGTNLHVVGYKPDNSYTIGPAVSVSGNINTLIVTSDIFSNCTKFQLAPTGSTDDQSIICSNTFDLKLPLAQPVVTAALVRRP